MQTATIDTRVWSGQQEAIFQWFEMSEAFNVDLGTYGPHAVVRARAGTGKTTTIVEGVIRLARKFPERRIIVCAFNKRIAEELVSRFQAAGVQNVVVKTLHAIGFEAVRRYKTGVKILSGSERADWLTEQVTGPKVPDTIKRLISKLHTKGREIAPHAVALGDLTDMAITFECEPDESWKGSGFDLTYIETKALAAMELASNNTDLGIDFADMIFLPVRNAWLSKTFDDVVVDEAQDMTNAQLEIAVGICKDRICIVGDNRQAIYAFRGADSESLDRLKAELQAVEFPLTVTYRCGRHIVEAAQAFVPDFEAGPNNPDGEITYLEMEKLTVEANLGDFILSRLNAPLVSTALKLLRAGKRARIAGRDIGTGLKSLVRRLAKGPAQNSVAEFLKRVSSWEAKEVARYTSAKRQDKVDAARDQASMLIELSDGASSMRDLESKIDALFTDDGLGTAGVITCSSVHRAKGLEASKVFILAGTMRNWNQEELNIQYVAITRAKTQLVFVA